jgi:hypothetical protein
MGHKHIQYHFDYLFLYYINQILEGPIQNQMMEVNRNFNELNATHIYKVHVLSNVSKKIEMLRCLLFTHNGSTKASW